MKCSGHRKLFCELSNFYRRLNEHWYIYSCLQIPPKENWLQYVRRVYATAINFPCLITLIHTKGMGVKVLFAIIMIYTKSPPLPLDKVYSFQLAVIFSNTDRFYPMCILRKFPPSLGVPQCKPNSISILTFSSITVLARENQIIWGVNTITPTSPHLCFFIYIINNNSPFFCN